MIFNRCYYKISIKTPEKVFQVHYLTCSVFGYMIILDCFSYFPRGFKEDWNKLKFNFCPVNLVYLLSMCVQYKAHVFEKINQYCSTNQSFQLLCHSWEKVEMKTE